MTDLRCDSRIDPAGIDTDPPRLSWRLASPRRGERQTAYRLQAASSPDLLRSGAANLWDSGKVASDRTLQIPYSGRRFESRRQVFWRVRAWDRGGRPSAWSRAAVWRMGLLSPADWKGRWIAAPSGQTGLPVFRAAFRVAKPLRRAELFLCGLGAMEPRLNGRLLDDSLFEPGWTNYRKTCLYRSFDLTGRLRRGENVLGVMLGNGMYNVTGGRYVKFTGSFGPPKLIGQLHLDYADGSREVIASGRSWRTAPGPITFSCVYGGEDYDARREIDGWDHPGFDASSWATAVETTGPGGRLAGSSRSAPPVTESLVLKPIGSRRVGPAEWLFDLGQNCSVMPRLTLRGRAGARVSIFTGEEFKDGRFVGGSSNLASFHYTLRGRGDETWSPRFTYAGARYLLIRGAEPEGKEDRPPDANREGPAEAPVPILRSVAGRFVTSSAAAAGEFSCSSDLFNRTARMIRWAMRSNMMSILTDCPHREKLGWLEQIHLVGPSLMYSYDLPSLYAKMTGDMADSQLPNGLVPDIAPEYVVFEGGFRDSPEWGSACVLVPWNMYRWYGDEAVLRRHYPMMRRYVEYLDGRSDGGTVSHGLADWYAIDPTPAPQTATAFYYLDLVVLGKTARLLGRAADAARYERLAARVRDAYNARFFDPKTGQYRSGTQAANALPAVLGIARSENLPGVIEAIANDVRRRGNALTAGDVGYRYLLRALADHGRSGLIFDMNRGTDHPGYGMMLAKGATSLPEAWNADPASSLNHFMLGHIMEWFYADLAGIRLDPAVPAFGRIEIRPQPVGDLTWVKARYDSTRGPIRSEWRRGKGRLEVKVEIPANTTAAVHLPAASPGEVAESGVPAARAEGVRFRGRVKGSCVFEIGAGPYRFTLPFPPR